MNNSFILPNQSSEKHIALPESQFHRMAQALIKLRKDNDHLTQENGQLWSDLKRVLKIVQESETKIVGRLEDLILKVTQEQERGI